MFFLPFNAWKLKVSVYAKHIKEQSILEISIVDTGERFWGPSGFFGDASPIALCVSSISRWPNQPHRCQVVASRRKRKSGSSSPLSRKSVDRTLSFFWNPWCSRNARHQSCTVDIACFFQVLPQRIRATIFAPGVPSTLQSNFNDVHSRFIMFHYFSLTYSLSSMWFQYDFNVAIRIHPHFIELQEHSTCGDSRNFQATAAVDMERLRWQHDSHLVENE